MIQRVCEAATAMGDEEMEMKGREEKRRTDTLPERATLLYPFH